jgi:hypothetical protein
VQLPRARIRLKGRKAPRSGAAQRIEATCVVAAVRAPPPLLLCAALIQPPAAAWRHASLHCRSRKPSPSRCAPSSRHCYTFSVSRSVAPSAPSSCCYPSRRRRLSMRAAVAHRVLLPPPPLHVGSAASTLEAKPRHHSPVMRPPELHHCRPYSGESRATTTMVPPTSIARPYPIFSPRADRLREHCRGHQCRRVAPAIPRPNWRLPEDRVHTSHLPDRSTPFLHDISSRMPTTTPAPTASPRTRSPSEPLLLEMPQSSSP